METDNYGRPITGLSLWLRQHARDLWMGVIAVLCALGIALTAMVMAADHCSR